MDEVSLPTQLLKVTARVHLTERRLTGSSCRTEYTFVLPANSLMTTATTMTMIMMIIVVVVTTTTMMMRMMMMIMMIFVAYF